MAVGDFDTYYGQNPWEVVDKNQREWYFPEVTFVYQRNSLMRQFVPWTFNMRNINATEAIVTQLLPPHPSANPIPMRQMWADTSHIDSRRVRVRFNHYGGKVSYHKYDEMVTYWKLNPRGGVRRIMQTALGMHMVDTLDLIARNAYIEGALNSGFYAFANNKTDFASVATTDLFDPTVSKDVWLRMLQNGVANGIGTSGATSTIYCITTPGVIYDIQAALESQGAMNAWIPVDPQTQTSRYEVGQYYNVRFLQSPAMILWNSGTILFQDTVTAPINAGDGAPNPDTSQVDGAYEVGQTGAVHYIQLSGTPSVGALGTDLNVNDMVTVHVSRLPADTTYGVANGVDFRDSRNHVRRVVSIDQTNNRIVLDRPIMIDMNTDLGGGVYAYVTKGRNIHASLFIGDVGGVVGAVSQAPMVHQPPTVDDFMSIYRFAWDAYLGINLYRPEVFEVFFSAGSTRVKGPTVIQ